MLVHLVVPPELSTGARDGLLEGEKGAEGIGVDGVARGEGSGDVSAGSLVS